MRTWNGMQKTRFRALATRRVHSHELRCASGTPRKQNKLMTDLAEYALCFSAAAIILVTEGLFLLAIFFGGLAIRAVYSKLIEGAD